MLNTPHLLTGAAIGVATGDPVLAFFGAIASHFILDLVPHFDPGTFHFGDEPPIKVDERDLAVGFIDLALAFFLLIWLAGTAPIIAWAPALGMFGGILPDIIGLSPLAFPKLYNKPGLHQYFKFTSKYHYTVKPKMIWLGILTQLVVIGAALWILVG